MFDVGFSEILLILVIALIVVGPERLPKLARTAGLWIGKARSIVSSVKAEVELPAAVAQAIESNVPDAEIDFVEVAEENGITLYDIEFKADRGEIEVAADGTVIDVVTVITKEDLPEAAAKAIQDAIGDATILRLEKSEIRSEIKKEGEMGTLVKLDTPRYVYEAELERDGKTGEIEVDAEGNITEPLKWDEN